MLGVLCIVGSSISFSINDMSVKFLSGDYPLHQIVFTRAITALVLILLILVPLEGGYANLKTKKLPLHLARGLCMVIANTTFFLALASISLPEATSIFFVAPLIISAFSVIFLGEKVGLRRWGAVGVGFIGVVVMMRPGTGSFQLAMLLPIIAATAYASSHMLTRKMGMAEKASTMTFYIQITFLFVSTMIGLVCGDGRFSGTGNASLEFMFRPWVMPQATDFMIMIGIGLLSTTGAYLVSQAYRMSEAALVAPLEYMVVPLSIFWGITVFGEWPDIVAWLGIALILGAGLFVFMREVQLGRHSAIKRPMPRNR